MFAATSLAPCCEAFAKTVTGGNGASRCFGVMPPRGPNAACVVWLIDRLVHRCEWVLIEGESQVLATGTQEIDKDLIHDTAAEPTPRFAPAKPTLKNRAERPRGSSNSGSGDGAGRRRGTVRSRIAIQPDARDAPVPTKTNSIDSNARGPRTLYAKIWDAHVIERLRDGTCLMAIDRQLIYEYSSTPAFKALREAGRAVRRPSSTLAMADHSVPTKGRDRLGSGMLRLLDAFRADCAEAGITVFELSDPRHGIVHVVGPEQGFTQPGLMMACADSHTSSHGALGALAFGVGSSELAHVLATQTLLQKPSKTFRVTIEGELGSGVSAKDLALALIGRLGVRAGVGYAIEFAGSTVAALDMPGRLTLCNMSVEAGARSALVAPDEITFSWLKGRPMAPAGDLWTAALDYWRTLSSDPGAVFDREVHFDAADLRPQVTWGTSPEQVISIDALVPAPQDQTDPDAAERCRRALSYMGLTPGTSLTDVRIDRVFIGSCTNARLADLRSAADVARGRHLAPGVHGMVVPGSGLIKQAAEAEGLDRVFIDAGFEWRDAGCSMCFASPHDNVASGERCASTSNRNFENRQGLGSRTHLVSPAMAAAAGIAGRFIDVRALAPITEPGDGRNAAGATT